jgi:2-phosphoglycerate kinase
MTGLKSGRTQRGDRERIKKEALAHVLWMGGSPCSGKSSIATILAERYGLRTYHVDEAYQEHRQCLDPARHPCMHKWTTTPWDELWMQPAEVLLSEAITCYGEHFQLVLEDLLALPQADPLLVEGTALLPDRVASLLLDHHQALWVVPTEAFQREHYPRRGAWVGSILSQCQDPEGALQNWMDRDVAFAKWVTGRARALGLSLLEVDGQRTIAENAATVAGRFQLDRGRQRPFHPAGTARSCR